MNFPSRDAVEQLRQQYPAGKRVVLLRMDDPQAPPPGTEGTVVGVDDIGSIMVHWDNGSGLSVAYGKDLCREVLPDEVPGSVLTLVQEGDDWVPVGPIPKIDVTQMPSYARDSLCRTLLECIRDWLKDPEMAKKFEAWKAKHKAEEDKL